MVYPFDRTGTEVRRDGIRRHTGLPQNLLQMLRSAVHDHERELNPHDLLAFAQEHLANLKVPQFLAVRTEPLPRSPGSEVLKPPLREQTDWHPAR